jgi:hypothetical protein
MSKFSKVSSFLLVVLVIMSAFKSELVTECNATRTKKGGPISTSCEISVKDSAGKLTSILTVDLSPKILGRRGTVVVVGNKANTIDDEVKRVRNPINPIFDFGGTAMAAELLLTDTQHSAKYTVI